MIIKITEQTAGERLDKFLAAAASPDGKLSRSRLQKLIKQALIKVNDRPTIAHYLLKAGDEIGLAKNFFSGRPAEPKRLENFAALKIKIINETAEFLVVNKPAGLAVHGTSDRTLADWLKEKYPGINSVGDDPERPGIVHRLDKDVSGLMVIAKTQASFADLKKQFQNRTVEKEYTALAYGKIQKDSGVINFPVKRARDGYKMAALPLTVKGEPAKLGRPAETQFAVIKKFINYTLLKIKIITGRTHQIRTHLAAYGHPLAGDNIYATAKTRLKNKKLNLGRIFLIADRLSFRDLAGERADFKISLTEELKNLLKRIK